MKAISNNEVIETDKANIIFLIREMYGNAWVIQEKTIDAEIQKRALKIRNLCDEITKEMMR